MNQNKKYILLVKSQKNKSLKLNSIDLYKSRDQMKSTKIAPISMEIQENMQPSQEKQPLSKMLVNSKGSFSYTPVNPNLEEANQIQGSSK